MRPQENREPLSDAELAYIQIDADRYPFRDWTNTDVLRLLATIGRLKHEAALCTCRQKPEPPPMKLKMPDGREVDQGGPEDRATWWTCTACGFHGPHVGTDDKGRHVCMGIICGGTTQNPNVPRIDPSRLVKV